MCPLHGNNSPCRQCRQTHSTLQHRYVPPPLVFPSLTTPSGSKMQPEHVKQCVDDTDKHSALAIIGTSHTLFSLLHFHHSPRWENTGWPWKHTHLTCKCNSDNVPAWGTASTTKHTNHDDNNSTSGKPTFYFIVLYHAFSCFFLLFSKSKGKVQQK